MNKAVFWDRDGVMNKMLYDETGYRHSPRRLEDFQFTEGIEEVMAELQRRGYLLVVVTNQPEVKRGLLPIDELERMNGYLRETLPLTDVYVCMHDNDDGCECRKPEPGMLLRAAEKWAIDLQSSFMVGDMQTDVEAARRAGCQALLLHTDYNADASPDIRLRSVEEILRHCF
jgi:D-glycero-D-manno-heptose 1,7-bisphosphate phosphatase